MPLHYILGNDTLAELARRRPKSRDELLAIKGIGPVKAERYGTALLEIVGDSDERGEGREEREEGTKNETRVRLPRVLLLRSTSRLRFRKHPLLHSFYWTQRLLQAGFSVDECAAIRGLSRETVLEHARLGTSG